MKPEAKLRNPQLNLPLLDSRPAELPRDLQRELAEALAELLLSAVVESTGKEFEGGDDEREAD